MFFKSPEYQVRAGAALAGSIVVMLAMILAYQLTHKKSASLVAGLVFAFSPWLIQFSRMAFETIFMLMVLMLSLSVFLKWLSTKNKWWLYFSGILLGLNVYTYRPMSLFAPLLVVVLIIFFFKELLKMGVLRVLIWLLMIAIIIVPFLYVTTIVSADQPRINQISIFSNPDLPIMVQRNREVDSSDYSNPQIGKKATVTSFFFHSKALSYLSALAGNYYKTFSTQFLFISGDPNGRHSPKNTGELLFVDAIGLIAGLAVVARNLKDKRYLLLLALLLLAPIPSDLTVDGADHASRLMILAGPLLIIVSLGYTEIVYWIAKERKHWFVLPLLIGIWLLAVIFYLHQYFIHYPIESARDYGYGYKQAIEKINGLKNDYKEIRLTEKNDPPMLYYLFWSKIPPGHSPLDLVRPQFWKSGACSKEVIDKFSPNTVYMLTHTDLYLDFRNGKDKVPTGIRLLDIIKYPDNEVAYYLITRDTKNGTPVLADKVSACK